MPQIDARPCLLDRLDEIDTEWLSAALRAGGYRDAMVSDFVIAPIGNGNVSDTVRIDIRYIGTTTAPSSIVCKFRSSAEAAHAHGVSSGSYFRETGSYRTIGQACRTPKLLWLDGGHDNINLVMEDLTSVARAGDQIAGCGLEDARAVVVELAKLHRHFFPMSAEEAPDWAMNMATTAEYWSSAIGRALPVIREHVASRLTRAEMATAEDACEVAYRWFTLPMTRGTLTHGDPRVDNILFLDGVAGEVQAVLIDWQLTGWRNPMHDLGYFLSGSVLVENRRTYERELLRLYAETFGSRYSLAAATEDYRVQLLSGLMTTIASYGLLPLTPKYDDLLLTLMRRNLAAAADWDSIAATRAIG